MVLVICVCVHVTFRVCACDVNDVTVSVSSCASCIQLLTDANRMPDIVKDSEIRLFNVISVSTGRASGRVERRC